MRHYSVHQPPWAPAAPEAARFIKEGFSWPAFLLTGFWLLWNRLWVEFAIFVAIIVAMEVAFHAIGVGQAMGGPGSFIIGLALGFEGNELVRAKLARKGYVEVGEVAARDLESAELRYFSAQSPAVATVHAGS